jgi:hypothetical protein
MCCAATAGIPRHLGHTIRLVADICEDRHARLQDGLASVADKADAIEVAIAEVQRLEAAALQQHTHATAAVG